MRRDMDLIRHIMLEVEDVDGHVPYERFASDEHSFDCVLYHVQLMQAHGLIDVKTKNAWEGGKVVQCEIVALTWDGCDYLDAIREDKVWYKTKKAIKETVGSTTMGLIKEVAVAVSRQAILASLGV